MLPWCLALVVVPSFGGCTREVELPQSDEGPQSEAGPSQADDQPSGGQSPDPSEEESKEPEPSAQESPEATQGSESDPGCEELAGFECSKQAPTGWMGPFRVNQASTIESLAACEAATPSSDVLYEDWSAKKAACDTCRAELVLPKCRPVYLVGYHTNGNNNPEIPACVSGNEVARTYITYDYCVPINSLFEEILPEKVRELDFFVPGPVHRNASCTSPKASMSLPPIEAETYWRVCSNAQDMPKCKASGMKCLAKRTESPEAACIYHAGEVGCPQNSPYQKKVATVSQFEDERGCSECTAELVEGNQDDDFECEAHLEYFERGFPNCNPGDPSGTPDPEAVSNLCLKASQFLEDFGHIYVTRSEPKYSGHCNAGGGEPIGEARPKAQITVCCTQ